MAVYTLKRKTFTRYDETDTLKGMKDSDVLAEKKRHQDVGRNVANGAMAAAGAGIAGAATGYLGNVGYKAATAAKGARMSAALGAAKSWKPAAYGAGVAAGLSALRSAHKANKQAEENSFYNRRLGYAQKQARRRERKDWRTNQTQRDGYSY